ncbi:MAG: phenylalanine--tRNA ligase subunit beta [Elusimicrobiota bacterium]
MRVPIDWLKDFVEFDLSPDELAENLTNIGLEIEEIKFVNGKPVLDIELTPNRGDCASIKGVAREVSAFTGNAVKSLDKKAEKNNYESDSKFSVEVKDSKKCPAYYLQYIEDVKIEKSSPWIKERLESCGVRPQNNIVDITNYVMLETGQPLHAFDAHKIKGNKVVVRKADNGEKVRTLDGQLRELTDEDLVIADNRDPVAIAGVMGGKESAVSAGTRNILLESAYFESSGISATSRRLGVHTDASYRFARNVNPEGIKKALNRCMDLIISECGGKPASGKLKYDTLSRQPVRVKMGIERINNLLGTDLGKDDIKKYLEIINFKTEFEEEKMTVTVPAYRPDVERPVDIIEEVARLHGYESMVTTLPETEIDINFYPRQDPRKETEGILKGAGYQEAVTHTIINSNWVGKITPSVKENLIKIDNPINKEMNVLRPVLMYSLLNIAGYNLNQKNDIVGFYERGPVFVNRADKYIQDEHLGFLGFKKDFFEAKNIVMESLNKLNQDFTIDYRENKNNIFKDNKQGTVISQDNIVGYFGEINRDLLKLFNLKEEQFSGGYINLDKLDIKKATSKKFRSWSKYPSIVRDLSLVADRKLTHKTISDKIKNTAGNILTEVQIYDVYSGKNIETGKKNLTYKLVFNSRERTLKSEEVNKKVEKILNVLKREFGIYLRAG